MKYLIASDIHGSTAAAKTIIELFENCGADKLVLLGDLYYHGPRNPLPQGYAPMEVAKLFNGLADKIIAVKGNCDAEVDQMISDFKIVGQKRVVSDGAKILFTHGHRYNQNNLPKSACDVMFFGHTHKSFISLVGDTLVVNVGSISLPKQDNAKTVALLCGREICLINAEDSSVLTTAKF